MGSRRLIKIGAALAALAVAGAGAQASAAPVTVTYQGLVTAGSDPLNLFGDNVSVGDVISAVFSYDVTLGTRTTSASSDVVDGGLGFGTTSPILTATYTIDGRSYSFVPDYYGYVGTGKGLSGFNGARDTTNVAGNSAQANSLFGDASQVYLNTSGPYSTNLATSFSSSGTGQGYFDTAFDANNNSDEFTFSTSSVMVDGISAAPEPSTWLLMIAGIGFGGLTLRRRTQPQLALRAA